VKLTVSVFAIAVIVVFVCFCGALGYFFGQWFGLWGNLDLLIIAPLGWFIGNELGKREIWH
jgi:hypothetical protein